jgi:hypothetical protein
MTPKPVADFDVPEDKSPAPHKKVMAFYLVADEALLERICVMLCFANPAVADVEPRVLPSLFDGEPDIVVPTVEQLQGRLLAAVVNAVNLIGKADVLAILQRHGGNRLAEIPEQQYPALLRALNAVSLSDGVPEHV